MVSQVHQARQARTGRPAGALMLLGLLLHPGCASTQHPADIDPMLAYPIVPTEQALIDDAQDRVLEHHDMLTAALIASGVVEPEALRAHRMQLMPILDAIVDDVRGIRDDEQRGRALLASLHRRLLGEYRATASSLVEVAHQHIFNCVSATVMYNTLAERVNLIVKAVVIPSHVYAVQFTGRGPIEIETTSPQGFAPDRRSRNYLDFLLERGLSRSHTSLAGDEEVPEQMPAAEIDNITLVSLILSNRALEAVARGEVPLANALLKRGGRLAERERSLQLRAHQSALINNLALDAMDRGDPERALRLIDLGWEDAPASSRKVLRNNRCYVIDQLASAHATAGRHEEALAVYQRGILKDPEASSLIHNRAVLINKWALGLHDSGRLDEAIAVLERGVALDRWSRFLTSNLSSMLYERAGQAVRRGDCGAARPDIARGHKLGVQNFSFLQLETACSGGAVRFTPAQPPAPVEAPEKAPPDLPLTGQDQGLW